MGTQDDDRPRIVQCKGLGHEIVLAADAADDLPVSKPIGNHVAHECCHHGVVDEARLYSGAALRSLASIQFVDIGNGRHMELGQLRLRHIAQCFVK